MTAQAHEASVGDARVSVVIATRNRAEALDRTLVELRALSERPPIVVVDNGSSDATREVAGRHGPHVSCLALSRNAGAAARNIGVAHVSTPYVALCDDDSWWSAGSLTRAADHLDRHPRLGLVAARVLVGAERTLDPVSEAMERSPIPDGDLSLAGVPVLGFVACGAVVRRGAYCAAGGFHPRFGVGGEEQLLAIDLAELGWELRYCDEIVAIHYPSPQRDVGERERCLLRNRLWTTWLRRPTRLAVRATMHALLDARWTSADRAAIADAFKGLPWALRERRVVRPQLDMHLRLLDSVRL
jgi:GT2 family glycosyltransferase